jgi:AhpD family alkylhydroperoxidase
MSRHASHVDYQTFLSLAPDAYGGLAALSKTVDASGLDKQLTELVKLRVSQINGCAFCVAIHLKMARKFGVDQAKLDLVATWCDAGLFSDREIAALAWAEQTTLLAGSPPPDEAYAALREQFSESEAVFLTVAVATINAWNRLGVGLRFSPRMS